MKKVVIVIIGLLAIFSILRAYPAETENRLNIYPSSLEFADKDSEVTIGFGLIENSGNKSMVWNIFPIKISLNTGANKFSLAFNGISFLTANGINFEKPMVIDGVHKGDVISFGGKVTITGRVEGSVWVFGADTELLAESAVIGDVVALGGKITADEKVVISGNKYALPELRIPIIGLLSSGNSIQTIHFFIELFQIALSLLLLFLFLFFREDKLKAQSLSLFQKWKGSLITMLLSIIMIPVLFFFLITSLIGILIIPVLVIVIILVAFYGFSSIIIAIGKIFLHKESATLGHFYLCGVVGLFLIKGFTLIGILFTLLNANILVIIGNLFTALGAIALFVAFLYSFGATLIHFRSEN